MKRITSMAAIALLSAASAYAQTQFEPAIPRGIPDTAVQPSRELAQPAPAAPAPQVVEPVVPRLVMNRARGRTDADARQCLQLATNRQIHRCAERYLPRAARKGVRRTKAARSAQAIAPSARAKAADLGKPDMSKAADPAKPVDLKAGAASTPPATKSVIAEKPSATPKPAAPEKGAEKTAERPPKWTDGAKALVKKQGDRLLDEPK